MARTLIKGENDPTDHVLPVSVVHTTAGIVIRCYGLLPQGGCKQEWFLEHWSRPDLCDAMREHMHFVHPLTNIPYHRISREIDAGDIQQGDILLLKGTPHTVYSVRPIGGDYIVVNVVSSDGAHMRGHRFELDSKVIVSRLDSQA